MLGRRRSWVTSLRSRPDDHPDDPEVLRRRQLITLAFVCVGGVVLALSLRIEPGNPWFTPAALLLAVVWTVGAIASGPLRLGRTSRPVVPVLIGVGLAALFVLGALVVREVPPLADLVRDVIDHVETGGSLVALAVVCAVTGAAEELFFRGAVYAAVPARPVLWSTLAYGLATLATGNVMLAFAAVVLGAVVGLERRATGGLLAPVLTHVSWSLTMLLALPALF